MPIFISYTHSDRDFVDQLALHLVANNVHVWLDRWEIKAGESLITKIEEGISGASALLVVLSKASLESRWCRKELNSGLMLELEKKSVVVVPILKEKCEIPLFLKEKLYANFTKDFDEGLEAVLESVASVTNDKLGRLEEPKWYTDWGISVDIKDGRPDVCLTLLEIADEQPYSVIASLSFSPNAEAQRWYNDHVAAKSDHIARHQIVCAFAEQTQGWRGRDLILRESSDVRDRFEISLPHGIKYVTTIRARRLGKDTGKSIVVHLREIVLGVAKSIEEVIKGTGKPKTAKKPSTGKAWTNKKKLSKKAAKRTSSNKKHGKN